MVPVPPVPVVAGGLVVTAVGGDEPATWASRPTPVAQTITLTMISKANRPPIHVPAPMPASPRG
jgi:hypothetical protein